MSRRKKPSRPRTAQREKQRAQRKLVRDRERLAALEPGGGPDRPIVVVSPSVIEPRARSQRCPQCGGAYHTGEIEARIEGGRRLRRLEARCRQCQVARWLWFAIAEAN